MKNLKVIPGIRLKFRESDDGEWIVATVWLDDEPTRDIGRIAADHAGPPGGDVYQGWVAAMSAAFGAKINAITGEQIAVLRRKADYKGERSKG